jgi:hypothetical protein
MVESDYRDIRIEKKMKMCNKVLEFASRLLWLEEILIEFKPESFFANLNIDAVFLKENFTIVVNLNWLERVGISDFTATVLHETRHAYQYAQVEYGEYMMYREPDSTVNVWKKEFENYTPSTGTEHNDADYIQQEVEVDAVAFEKQMMKELLDINMNVHHLIRDRVNAIKIVVNETMIN